MTYREVTVGKVTGYELGQTADRVLIHILIEPKYAPLVRSGDEADWKYIRRHDVVKATVNVQADEPELDEV